MNADGASAGATKLRVDCVRDTLQQRGVVCEGRDVAPGHVLRAGEEVVVAGGADSVEGCVDFGLADHEGGERGIVGLGHRAVSEMVSGIMTAPVGADDKRHGKRTPREHRPRPVLHPCCTEESGLDVSLWNLWGVLGNGLEHEKGAWFAPSSDLSL